MSNIINPLIGLVTDASQVCVYDCLNEVKEKISCKYENGYMAVADEIYQCVIPGALVERLPATVGLTNDIGKMKISGIIQLGIVIFGGKIYTGFARQDKVYATNFVYKEFSIPDIIISMAWYGDALDTIFKPCAILKNAYAAAIRICESFKQNRNAICSKLTEVQIVPAMVSANLQQLKTNVNGKSYIYNISSNYLWFARMFLRADFEAVNEYYDPKITVCRTENLFCLAIKCGDTMYGVTLIPDIALLRYLYIHRTLVVDKLMC